MRRMVWCLALGQVVVWAAMYYSFPAMLLVWEGELGWSKAELSGAFSLSLVVSGALAPLSGRLIDRGKGKWVLVGGTTLGALSLIGLSMVTQVWHFYFFWGLLGISMAGCLYEPCFAVITRVLTSNSQRAITLVTLIAGFAGTVSFPSCHALVEWYGWRATVLILGSAVMMVGLPLMWLGCAALGEETSRNSHRSSARAQEVFTVMRKPVFWCIAGGFALVALNHGILITHLLPLLEEREIQPQIAVFAASMIGPMQVVGRLVMMGVERYISMMTIAVSSFVAVCIAGFSLWGANSYAVLLILFVVLQGAGYGVTSITRPVVTSQVLGKRNFGVISGMIAVPYILFSAIAPIIAAFVWGFGGYGNVVILATVTALLGLMFLAIAMVLAIDQHAL